MNITYTDFESIEEMNERKFRREDIISIETSGGASPLIRVWHQSYNPVCPFCQSELEVSNGMVICHECILAWGEQS